jgi:hypothetical protein
LPVKEDDRQAYKSSDGFDDIARNSTNEAFNDIIKNSYFGDSSKKESDDTSPEDLADREEQASEGINSEDNKSAPEESEQQALNNKINWRGSDSGEVDVQGNSNRKKAGIGIGILTLLGGGSFGLFGMLAQPLQLMQMSSFLQRSHFSSSENVGDDRMTKIGRFIRYRNDERTRMGIVGNAYANRLEARLNESGLRSTYEGPGSTFTGYDIDTENISKSKTLGELSGKSPEQIAEGLRSRFNLSEGSITISETGKIRISAEGTLSERRMLRAALEEAGFSKIGAAVRARIMGKRAGTTWNPVKKLDRKILAKINEVFASWKASRESGITSGEGLELEAKSKNTVDETGDGKPDAASAETANATDNINNAKVPETPEATIKTPAAEVEAVQAKFSKAAGISAVIGILCTAKALANEYDKIKQSNVVLPLMRLGTEGLAVGNQIITGQNLDSKQVDYMTKLLYDPETKTSWTSAKSVQYEMGKPLTGPDISPEAKISSDKNIFTEVLSSIPTLDQICDVAGSVVGQIVTITIDLVTGPLLTIGAFAAQDQIGAAFNGFVRWIAGHPINVDVGGANYGNYINYGARLAANDAAISGGGTKLTAAQVAELRNEEQQESQFEFSNKSMFAKIFDARDYRSVAGKFIMQQAPDPAQNIARVASLAPKSLSSIFGGIGNLLAGKAYASENYDYGFPVYGFSLEDQNNSLVDNPQENNKIVADLLDADTSSTISEKTKKCFGIDIVKQNIITGSKNQAVWAPTSLGSVPDYKDIPDECTSNDPNWIRVRFWIQDSQLMGAFGCFEDGANGTCDEFGLSPGSASTTTPGNYTVGIQSLSCEGYLKLSSTPATIVNNQPTNTYTVPYNSLVKSACQKMKDQCIAGVSGTTKAICSALELSDSWYGSGYSKINNTLSNQYYYGLTQKTNGLADPVKWYSSRQPGLNGNNLLECSALTTVAVYKAFGYSSGIGCSGNWGSTVHPDLFQPISWSDIKPGDFLTYSRECNTVSGFGHIAIAASNVDTNGNFVVFEQSSFGTTAHFRLANKNTWGVHDVDGKRIPFNGYLSRWIGQGL